MLMPAFHRFPKEAAIIGRLLAGYGELELELCNCVAMIRDDFDATLKAIFRTRGEQPRIQVADALGRHLYRQQGLGTDFEMAIGDINCCRSIRNRYAHCNWYDDNSGRLAFVNLEDAAKQNKHLTDLQSLTIHYVDVPTLEAQEAFFIHTDYLLAWVNLEGQKRGGKVSSHAFSRPKQMERPP